MSGKLTGATSSKSPRKKAFEWKFEIPGQDPIPVNVFLESSKDTLFFRAQSEGLSEDILSKDVNALHEQVETALRLQIESLKEITWENWLQIKISGQDHDPGHQDFYDDFKSEVALQVTPLKRGVSAKTGEILRLVEHSNGTASVQPFPKTSRIEEKTCIMGKAWFNGTETSFVPDTPENRVVLIDVLTRMRDLKERLAKLMSQESIALAGNQVPQIQFDNAEQKQKSFKI